MEGCEGELDPSLVLPLTAPLLSPLPFDTTAPLTPRKFPVVRLRLGLSQDDMSFGIAGIVGEGLLTGYTRRRRMRLAS